MAVQLNTGMLRPHGISVSAFALLDRASRIPGFHFFVKDRCSHACNSRFRSRKAIYQFWELDRLPGSPNAITKGEGFKIWDVP